MLLMRMPCYLPPEREPPSRALDRQLDAELRRLRDTVRFRLWYSRTIYLAEYSPD